MREIITLLIRWLTNRLNRILTVLENQNISTEIPSKFVDLAPTNRADKAGVYSEALLFATQNAKVFNIALTGPYGSGKSSIIQSFLTNYQMPTLHISLAAFSPEGDSGVGKVHRQDIERSILQQMLYGADANNLPLSRFKRIQSPGIGAHFKSLYILFGVISLSYVFLKLEDIFSGYFSLSFTASNWFNLLTVLFATTFLWTTLHHFYVASFGLSLKSISLKDVEIKPADEDQTSILNRHLDEIIYFFQSTKYELVIIEDLDRFEDADIFVTLREINRLVNENAGVKRPIKFLYALRDDMFVNIDRTKFFEFIIPVIPIINTSNSIDMVLEQGRRLKLDTRLDRQFLREVSRYLDDLRLIQNIFNEYAVYVSNLETDGDAILDANKLLAILIYKNVYPKDFEQLHRGLGALAAILNLKEELIRASETTYRADITEIETRLDSAEKQTPSDLRELKQIYAMALIEKLPSNVLHISPIQQVWIGLPDLLSYDGFEQLIENSRISCRTHNSHHSQSVDISGLQNHVDSQKSYQQRKEEIERKAADNKNDSLRQIHSLRSKLAKLRTVKLNEMLRLNSDRVKSIFKSLGGNEELARFLILEGHIDDTYYQYTSLFHAGRLSPNDNKFLIQIRAFVTPEPSFPIDNPKEVIAAMREEDFGQSYVLNVNLVDCLLNEPRVYRDQIRNLFEFISSEFDNCEAFFDAFYTSGRDVGALLSGLSNNWKDFVPKAIASSNNISHFSQMLSQLPENELKKLARTFDEFSDFVSENLPDILVNVPEIAPKRLALLNFEVKNLAAIKEYSEIVRFMFDKGLFELTVLNLEYIYQTILGINDLEPMREKNFTAIRLANNETLIKRVERDFYLYLRNVLLELQGNSEEDASAILAVVRHEELAQDDIEMFLERQTNQLPALDNVPEKLYAMLFKLNIIEPSWSNCLVFMESEGFEKEILIEYLERQNTRTTILKHPIPSDADSLKLREFILNAGSLTDPAYREYVCALPKQFNNPPKGIEPTKIRILISERKIVFARKSFDDLSEHLDLQIQFVAANIQLYLSAPDKFELDDDFLEELLRSGIDNAAKVEIVKLMDLEALDDFPKRAALVGSIIYNTNAIMQSINGGIAQSLVRHSSPVLAQISLLNRYQSMMTNSEVSQVLTKLPWPYSTITTGRHVPKLENKPENLNLVRWLESRNIISSWSDKSLFSDEIKVNLKRS